MYFFLLLAIMIVAYNVNTAKSSPRMSVSSNFKQHYIQDC